MLRFDLPAEDIQKAYDEVTKDFVKHGSVPGFRPGKAPVEMVVRQFESNILEETKRKVMSAAYQQALKDHKLAVVGLPDVEEPQEGFFAKDQPYQFLVKLEVEPEFELPAYRGLPAQREVSFVSEADITRALEALRKERETYELVDGPVQEGLVAVVNYTGSCEGKPIAELAPDAPRLGREQAFWVRVAPNEFIPGFGPQLIGAKAGETREVKVTFPADFPTRTVAGKECVYAVEILRVQRPVLPELNDEFAKMWEAENLERLRDGVRSDLQNELNQKQKKSIRNQIVRGILDRVSFELPESAVAAETRNIVYDIVSDVMSQGASKEQVEKQKSEISTLADRSAKDRVKLSFVLRKIADKEGIRVTTEEFNARVAVLAGRARMAPGKFVKELEKRGVVSDVFGQILHEKVIDFLAENARIQDIEPGQKT
jgi:trigger factor